MESITYPMFLQMSRSHFKYSIILVCLVIFCMDCMTLLTYKALFLRRQSTSVSVGSSTPTYQFDRQHRKFRTNVFFLKIRRTGGRTLQNILFRLSAQHSLDVILPETSEVILYEKLVDNKILSDRLMPPNGKFNIFASETRYSTTLTRFMYSDTLRITLLRNPSTHFASIYNSSRDADNLCVKLNMTYNQFLNAISTKTLNSTQEDHLRKIINPMSFQLGLDNIDNLEETTVGNFIDRIDREFDFVMISEYYDECLILLADLMGWPLTYVSYLYLPSFVASSSLKLNLTETDMKNSQELNSVDKKLYDHFMKKLCRKVQQYGAQRLLTNLRVLEALNDNLRRKCIAQETKDSTGKIVSYVLKSDANVECVHASKTEMNFIEELRRKQVSRFAEEKRILTLIRGEEINVV